MAKFTLEEAAAVASIQQLINEWALELDVHNGLNIGGLITDDCVYVLGDITRNGRAEVEKHYRDRLTRLSDTPAGVPVHRHLLSNLLVRFTGSDTASITFNLIYFSALGMASGVNHADPAAYADVRMDCRKDSDGDWRIAKFDSGQIFRRVLAS